MSESTNLKDESGQDGWDNRVERQRSDGHIWTGIFILAVGGLALARSMGAPMPAWLFSWQMLVIAIGLFIGFRKGFRDGGWFIPVIVGGFFLANEYFLEGDLRRHIWPMALIVVGAFFIFRPRSKRCRPGGKKNRPGSSGSGLEAEIMMNPRGETNVSITPHGETNFSKDDFIDSVNIFGGSKKVILAKNFKGGDVVCIFGGCEIDLTQADLATQAELEVTAIFGGATLIVPSNWAVQTDGTVTIFGGIGDKRKIATLTEQPSKTLILKGTMVFGGIEIKSY